jgi:hypothetical protein
MKLRTALAVAAAVAAFSGPASAAIVQYQITGGNWDSIAQWTAQATGVPGTTVYDNGETPACILCAPEPTNNWPATGAPPAMNGTYGGLISVDTANNAVVGGSLVVTGAIADAVVVGSTWWVRQYNNLSVNFATNVASTTSIGCYATIFAPLPCGPAVTGGAPNSIFGPRGGIAAQDPAGAGGITYLAATFDANTGLLQIFRDGRRADAVNGTDTLTSFTLQTQVIPVPAAVWLFGSALGLLGVARRKLAATA